MRFSNILKELRESQQLSQKELALALHISRPNISKYENGALEPNMEMLEKISSFFGVTIDYLLGRVKEKDVHVLQGKSIHPNLDGIGILKDIKLSDLTTQDIKELTEIVERITKRKESR